MPDAPPLAAPVRPLLPLALAMPASAAAGLVLTTAFPALAWWPMVFVAVPLALVCLVGRAGLEISESARCWAKDEQVSLALPL